MPFDVLDCLGENPNADRQPHANMRQNHGYSVPARKETLLRTSPVSHVLLDTSPTRCWIPPPRVVGHLSNVLLDRLTSVQGNNLDGCTGGGQQSGMTSAVRSQAAVIVVW